MGKIIAIGLGPGDVGSLTLDAVERLRDENKLFLRTEKHPSIKYLIDNEIEYSSYDYVYEQEEDFDDVYAFVTKDLVENSRKYGIIKYGVPGHPLVADKTMSLLIDLSSKGEIELEIIAGMSFIEPVIITTGQDLLNGLKILDALSLREQSVDINTNNLITQVYNKIIAANVKLYLSDIYGDDYEVFIINSPGIKDKEKVIRIPLYEIDRTKCLDHLTCIYIPKMTHNDRNIYDMNNLISIMERLRDKNGCPWDIKQTHRSLREFVLEEAYEVVDAIESEDVDQLVEELGDLLLQVIFHAQIGSDEGYFNFLDITSRICEKLIYRHPHVFSNIEAKNIDDANYNWNSMKDKEKTINSYTQRLTDMPKGLSALIKSYKVQRKAADVGFDWEDIEDVNNKVKEEFMELWEANRTGNKENIEEELGDLLFSIVNLGRFLDINPEVALNRTVNKFIERFSFMEKESSKSGKDLKNMDLESMDNLWELAKIHKNKKNDKK